jgi:LPS sulfotransferase NodH
VEYAAAALGARRSASRFVIVSGPRTGSELLRELLDSLADVRCEGELLQQPRRWPLAYVNGRAALGGLGGRAWGCKILDSHLHLGLVQSRPPGHRLLPALVDDGWTVIHLQRQDLLAQALSFLRAMDGQWHFRGR